MISSPLIELRDLTYRSGRGTVRERVVLKELNLSVRAGDRLCIVGGPRSGKSTLLQAIASLVQLEPGHVFFHGSDVASGDFDMRTLRRELGVVFQHVDAQLIEDIVGKDVAFGPTALGVPAEETRARVEQSLDAVGLPYPEFRLRYIYSLSGGEQRRAAIAGTLAMQPKVLLLDEPMGGLDPGGRRGMVELLQSLLDDPELTLIMCSASLEDVAALCDRAVVLDAGRVVRDGPLHEIMREPAFLAGLNVSLTEVMRVAADIRAVVPLLPDDLFGVEDLIAAVLARTGGGHA